MPENSVSNNLVDEAIEAVLDGEDIDVLSQVRPDLATLLLPLPQLIHLRESVPVPDPEPSLTRWLELARRETKDSTRSDRLENLSPVRLMRVFSAPLIAVVFLMFSALLFFGMADRPFVREILPGQPLYTAKRLGESLALALPRSEDDQDTFLASLAARRQAEIIQLQENKQAAQFFFSGIVERIEPQSVLVSGIVCPLACAHLPAHEIPEAEITGLLQVGVPVLVDAYTLADGSLHIARIEVQAP